VSLPHEKASQALRTASLDIDKLSEDAFAEAFRAGWDAVPEGTDLLCLGEMGIANTTAAAALLACLGPADPSACIGRGTGVDDAGLARKRSAVAMAYDRHHSEGPLAVLAGCGGLEIAAMTGAMLTAAANRCPVLVDGFIAGAAALVASRLTPDCRPYLIFAHRSQEQGHALLLDCLQATPLLDLGLRLGEGSGAALAVPVLRAACALHAEMATFVEAGVDDGEAAAHRRAPRPGTSTTEK